MVVIIISSLLPAIPTLLQVSCMCIPCAAYSQTLLGRLSPRLQCQCTWIPCGQISHVLSVSINRPLMLCRSWETCDGITQRQHQLPQSRAISIMAEWHCPTMMTTMMVLFLPILDEDSLSFRFNVHEDDDSLLMKMKMLVKMIMRCW
jgi:hypothetical protein